MESERGYCVSLDFLKYLVMSLYIGCSTQECLCTQLRNGGSSKSEAQDSDFWSGLLSLLAMSYGGDLFITLSFNFFILKYNQFHHSKSEHSQKYLGTQKCYPRDIFS